MNSDSDNEIQNGTKIDRQPDETDISIEERVRLTPNFMNTCFYSYSIIN